ncbi:coenzyme F420-0:L-glutamate ligase [Halorussus gelatinilyticus]|uniref:Coenzyme F420:L-glutamate ligase n=1 Tax=Halorussus gelatinilyticus TaxID=2937524 RepID=A0A8U0INR9_9EURY|nr:coenzyme F420-0:L-glutamate ligase [Halorussus gelatinilyticus]UPW02196.1 coenzyme F420-0:L-glutamate ligase [Halorussus gelatinilyticus]
MNVFAVPGLPEVRPGDDLAALVEAQADLRDDDVLLVASTVVSKAEGRRADLEDFPAGPRAREIAERLEAISGEEKDPRFAQAVLEESTEIIVEAPFLLTATKFGHVGVNAGIDRSNVGGAGDGEASDDGADLLLLPERPSESAARIRENLDSDPAVVVTDTSGRPFRHGQRGVAIGWAGIPASRDWRGEEDRDGHELEVTVEAVVDELAAAANLVTGEGDGGLPVAVVRDWEFGDHEGSDNLYRDVDGDFVRQALRGWEFARD